jgi:hypothetical protein
MDRYVTITQGEVFYITEALAQLEGLERGPAGNTSLTAAFAIAQEMEEDQVLVVQETEYTGAGKHLTAQLTFARERGIEVRRGNPREQIPGKNILLPSDPSMIGVRDLDLDNLRRSYLKNSLKRNGRQGSELLEKELDFLGLEIKKDRDYVQSALKELESW